MRTRIALVGAAFFAAAAIVSIIAPSTSAQADARAPAHTMHVRLAGAVVTPKHRERMASLHRLALRQSGWNRSATGKVAVDLHSLTAAIRAHVAFFERVLAEWRAAHSAADAPAAAAPAAAPAWRTLSASHPVVAATQIVSDATSTTTPDWACIRVHESGDRFNTPQAPGGAYGFLESTWLSLGYSGWPYEAPAAVQDQAVLFLYNELGWQPWSTRFVCGL